MLKSIPSEILSIWTQLLLTTATNKIVQRVKLLAEWVQARVRLRTLSFSSASAAWGTQYHIKADCSTTCFRCWQSGHLYEEYGAPMDCQALREVARQVIIESKGRPAKP